MKEWLQLTNLDGKLIKIPSFTAAATTRDWISKKDEITLRKRSQKRQVKGCKLKSRGEKYQESPYSSRMKIKA